MATSISQQSSASLGEDILKKYESIRSVDFRGKITGVQLIFNKPRLVIDVTHSEISDILKDILEFDKENVFWKAATFHDNKVKLWTAKIIGESCSAENGSCFRIADVKLLNCEGDYKGYINITVEKL